MMEASRKKAPAWDISSAQLPDRLDGWRVLEVGGDGNGADRFAELGATEFVACERPSESVGEGGQAFELADCTAGIDTHLHPLAVYAWLWHVIAPGGVLVLGSPVLDDPAHSQYAAFAPAEAESTSPPRWIPGRLALRWMVEVSGFDLQHWLGDHADVGAGVTTYLQATRTDREPALDLSRQPLNQ